MSVKDIFIGKKVFITGGTGFLGKVLIEKLLRSCPGVEKIYVLVRQRRGKSPEERLQELKGQVLFEKVRESDPECMKKLVAITGDVSELKLGMSDEDWHFIADNVNIIYNAAASIRFDDSLKRVTFMNVRSVREIASLALQTRNLMTFVHISTTYCNSDKKCIEEKIYPAHADWRMLIKLAEEADDGVMETLTMRFINPLPNTYTFSKALGEHVVNDMCIGKIPALILRPSIVVSIIEDPIKGWIDSMNGPVALQAGISKVVSIIEDPIKGWIDSMNGPVALQAGISKGLLRTVWAHPDCVQDCVPVDTVIKAIILATRRKILIGNKDEVEVYNCNNFDKQPLTVRKLFDFGKMLNWDSPSSKVLWYPRFRVTACWYVFYFEILFYHVPPAIFLDWMMAITGNKKIFMKICRKVYTANVILGHFMLNSWQFQNDRTIKLDETISEEDYNDFSITKFIVMDETEIFNFMRSAKQNIMTNVFKEEFNEAKAKKMMWRMWLLYIFTWSLIYCFSAWLLIFKFDIITVLYNRVYNYFANIPA